jgi:hypothetical protein
VNGVPAALYERQYAIQSALAAGDSESGARLKAELRRCYQRLQHRHATGVAKVAVARKLALRLYWMLRNRTDYAQLCGPYAGKPVSFSGAKTGPAA